MPKKLNVAVAAALMVWAGAVHAESYLREDLRLPMPGIGARGLETLFVRPDKPGKYPLVIISHGSPRNPADREKMSPSAAYPMAVEFARRGWAVAIVMRRGYGMSGGHDVERSHSCSNPDYTASGRTSAQDIKAAIKDLSRRLDIDGSRILAVGHSAGGFATVALTADPPPGLVAAISLPAGAAPRAITKSATKPG